MATSPKTTSTITGSCACGKVRFTTHSPQAVVYCYCSTCRKCSGAPYLPFVHFQQRHVQWEGEPDRWQKSDVATRSHCSTCGSCISMVYHDQADEIGIVLGCIDEGVQLIKPVEKCIYVKDRPEWAQLPKDVPCFDELSEPS